ncbi:hypothetical protein PR202_gb24620 [Eleusine coracana subsp. coracana]|uniref:PRA1 family protein n=1 Tax=Eleusine coracana subsp. coracana TaxID=191504 RepID=A0AAV5FM40_ELECO|nr:hypothetical protein QOZ80_5BG0450520 [Eleusine coracana subsp. coracana]GJN35813.1 hypothetical protein PR202_gb24620 [Eleusine coracana subsp. coracana]
MSKYGTIPRSSSAPASTDPSSQLLPILQVEERGGGASRLATHRPWRELTDPRALSLPPRGLADLLRRGWSNLQYFCANYAALVLLAVFLPLVWRPVAQLAFLACMVPWLALFFLRDEPIVLCGRAVPEGLVLAVLSALTLVALLIVGPVVNVLKALLVGLGVVLLHAVLHREAVRWYTIMSPPSTY